MDTVGIGIIGMGNMGRRHAQTVRQNARARLVAVTDIAGVPRDIVPSETAVVPNYRALLERGDVEAVLVCTPDWLHLDLCLEAISAGKHVMVEKPIADQVDQAQRIADAVAASDVKFLVAHILRFETRYAMSQEAVASGEFGDIISIHAHRQNGLGDRSYQARFNLVSFLGVHDYDLLRWYVSREVESVYAVSHYGFLSGEGVNASDSTWALLTFEDGTIGAVESCWVLPNAHPGFDQRLEVIGTKGTLSLEAGYQGVFTVGPSNIGFPDNGLWPQVRGRTEGALAAEWDHFLDCIQKGVEPLVTAEDGLAAVKIAAAVKQSAETRQPVRLDAITA